MHGRKAMGVHGVWKFGPPHNLLCSDYTTGADPGTDMSG